MQDHYFYDYAVIRVVPKVDREEFINAGVIIFCMEKNFLEAGIELNELRLENFSPGTDIGSVKTHLAAIDSICKGGKDAGPIGQLSQRERFHWLTSPRSTIIQTSPIHSGYCKNPSEELRDLVNKMVKVSS